MVTLLHAQARRFADAGIKVFPCLADAKQPATPNGFKDASDDLEQIDRWWSENPNYNIGLVPEDAGWCVIDIDPGGEATWIEAMDDGGYEPTYEVQTPRGGRHLYFVGSLPSTASKLATHVDTRGKDGYVLVPPSVVNGRPYEVLYDRAIAPLPDWIPARIATRNHRVDAGDKELDTDIAIARATGHVRHLVSGGDVAIEGHGGDHRTVALFALLKDLGVSGDTALRIVLEEGWNDACQPPWELEELKVKRDNGFKYAQNSAGAATDTRTAEEAFGKSDAFRRILEKHKTRVPRFKIWTEEDFDNQPEPTWIVNGLIPDDSIVLWIGPAQSFKSFMLLDVMLGVATGIETFGHKPEPGAVVYGAIEDKRNVGMGRRKAWKFGRGLNEPVPNFGVSDVPAVGMTEDFEAWIAQTKEWLGGRKLKLLAIDTAGKTLNALNENDSATVRLFYSMCNALRDEFGCTVIAIHHSGKDSERGARGSSAWQADFDSVIETIRPDKGLLNVEVVVRKHKNALEGQRWTFKGEKVAGSLVFSPTTAEEHKAAEDHSDPYAPGKVARILVEAGAATRRDALTTAEVWNKLGGALGDEAGVRRLERLAKTTLRALVDREGSILYWWVNPEPGGMTKRREV